MGDFTLELSAVGDRKESLGKVFLFLIFIHQLLFLTGRGLLLGGMLTVCSYKLPREGLSMFLQPEEVLKLPVHWVGCMRTQCQESLDGALIISICYKPLMHVKGNLPPTRHSVMAANVTLHFVLVDVLHIHRHKHTLFHNLYLNSF